jgi:nitrate reductase gamma subunit
MLSYLFTAIQIILGAIVGFICLVALYVLLFRWEDYS